MSFKIEDFRAESPKTTKVIFLLEELWDDAWDDFNHLLVSEFLKFYAENCGSRQHTFDKDEFIKWFLSQKYSDKILKKHHTKDDVNKAFGDWNLWVILIMLLSIVRDTDQRFENLIDALEVLWKETFPRCTSLRNRIRNFQAACTQMYVLLE